MIVVAAIVSTHTSCRPSGPLGLTYATDKTTELVIIVIIMLAIKIKPTHTPKMILEEESGPARRPWSQGGSSKAVIPDTRSCVGGLFVGGIGFQLMKPIVGPSNDSRKKDEIE